MTVRFRLPLGERHRTVMQMLRSFGLPWARQGVSHLFGGTVFVCPVPRGIRPSQIPGSPPPRSPPIKESQNPQCWENRMGGFRKGGFSNNRFVLKPDVAIASEVSILSKNSLAITDFHAKKTQHVQLFENHLPGTPLCAIPKSTFWPKIVTKIIPWGLFSEFWSNLVPQSSGKRTFEAITRETRKFCNIVFVWKFYVAPIPFFVPTCPPLTAINGY